MRAGSLGISLRTTFCQGCLAPQYPSKRSTAKSPFGSQETNLYGPVPMAALPELNCSLRASIPTDLETTKRRMKSFGRVGAGAFVFTCRVYLSATFVSATCFV